MTIPSALSEVGVPPWRTGISWSLQTIIHVFRPWTPDTDQNELKRLECRLQDFVS